MFPGIEQLQAQTRGNPRVCVAVLDGPVDTGHLCFQGAKLERLPTLVQDEGPAGGMAAHGTLITSLVFGQPGSAVGGIAPACRGLLVPIFSDQRRYFSQLDLARAINQAVEAGAHVINVSGGQRAEGGQADDLLERAVRFCRDRNVLVVAAAGNDGCACLHVPAALPAVLAVGAMDGKGHPMDLSNHGAAYETRGILAPGERIRGAAPGGGTTVASGTSFATPIVAGVAALLLSLQVERGEKPDPGAVRAALLKGASPCNLSATPGEGRCLAGKLNPMAALEILFEGERWMSENTDHEIRDAMPPRCTCGAAKAAPAGNDERQARREAAGVRPSQSNPGGSLVYALGVLGYDFGTEARRDSFKQFMPPADLNCAKVPPNPYDGHQMVKHLASHLSDSKLLIWTLNLELTPLYALEPVGPFAREVYHNFQALLEGQMLSAADPKYVERVSIPGRLSGRTARLFSGQVVPVIELESTRGIFGWSVGALQDAAIKAVNANLSPDKDKEAREALTSFLYKVYYNLRNLGQTSADRALNFAATNAYQASLIASMVESKMDLDEIRVEKSPFCRMDSDCWDVTLVFFHPENTQRARTRCEFTVDVSDVNPVSVGAVRTWSSR
jgi:PatG C-terminal/Subtilase family/PatG Domain